MRAEQNPFEMVGPLPEQVSHVQRVRVVDLRLKRDIEFRILVRDASEATTAAFFVEVHDLLRLDHPAFLPVLDQGRIRGRHCYTVPYRDHPVLADVARAEGLSRPEAIDLIRKTASILAAAHRAELPQAVFDPRWILWDRLTGACTISHRSRLPPRYVARPDLRLPPDVRGGGGEFQPRVDIFHWGVFAYFCVTGGAFPYRDDERLVPVAEHYPEVPRLLAATLESALARDPALRPGSGLDVVRVLRTMDLYGPAGIGSAGAVGADAAAAAAEAPAGAPLPPDPGSADGAPLATRDPAAPDAPSEIFRLTAARAESQTSIVEFRLFGAPEVDAAEIDPDVSESPHLESFLDDLHDSYESRSSLNVLRGAPAAPHGPGAESPLPARPVHAPSAPGAPPEVADSAPDEPGDDGPGVPYWMFPIGVVLGLLVARLRAPAGEAPVIESPALRGPVVASGRVPGPPTTSPRSAPDPGAAEDPGRGLVPLSPGAAVRYLRDDGIRRLLAAPPPDQTEIRRVARIVRDMALQGRLPSRLTERHDVARLVRVCRTDATKGKILMGVFLEDFRHLIGSDS